MSPHPAAFALACMPPHVSRAWLHLQLLTGSKSKFCAPPYCAATSKLPALFFRILDFPDSWQDERSLSPCVWNRPTVRWGESWNSLIRRAGGLSADLGVADSGPPTIGPLHPSHLQHLLHHQLLPYHCPPSPLLNAP